jgi:hypothetical protein
MKKGRLFLLLFLFGWMATTTHISPAQQIAKTESMDISAKEDCRTPVVVFGGLVSPSRFELHRKVRLKELIARVGGPGEHAKGIIQIFHSRLDTICENLAPSNNQPATDYDNPELSIETYKLADLTRNEEKANPYIRPGDVISLIKFDHVYITGGATTSREIFFKQPITLAQALAQLGISRDSKAERVVIYRFVHDDVMRLIEANLKEINKGRRPDVPLQSGDVIDVRSDSESEVRYPQRVMNVLYPPPKVPAIRVIK